MANIYPRLNPKARQIAEHYGLLHQLHKMREELLEAVEAVDDYIADPTEENKAHMAEELADVSLMTDQIAHLAAIRRAIHRQKEFKMTRQLVRIAHGG